MPQRSSLSSEQLAQVILQKIRTNKIGDQAGKLPPEPELMQQFNVTRYTLRQAIDALSQSGLVFQAHGSGVFARRADFNDYINLQESNGLSAEYAAQVKPIKTVQASQQLIPASEAEFEPIGSKIDPSETLIDIRRFRTLDGEAFVYEHSYYVASLIGMIPDEALYGSLVDYVKQTKRIKYGFADKLVGADHLPAHIAKLFNSVRDEPAVLLRDDFYTNTGQVYDYARSYFNYRNTKLFTFAKLLH